mgnify:CR=1 FL=1
MRQRFSFFYFRLRDLHLDLTNFEVEYINIVFATALNINHRLHNKNLNQHCVGYIEKFSNKELLNKIQWEDSGLNKFKLFLI